MGILEKFFKKKPNNLQKQNVSFGNLNDTFFTPFGTNFLNSETYLTCVRVNSSYASKLKVQSIREVEGERVHDYPTLDYLLQVRPNAIMNASTLYERVSYFYDLYNNAFIYIERDILGGIKHLWSIDPNSMELAQAASGEWLCRFNVQGEEIIEPYSDIIHLARDVHSSDVWGENHRTIGKVLDLINLNYQGIEKAIKTSGVLKYIATVSTKLSEDALKKQAQSFVENYLNVEADSSLGVAFIDSMVEIQPMPERTQKTANFKEAEELDNKVYNYLLCPKSIVDGTASDSVKMNYIETRLGPLMIKLKQEMEHKLFTKREYGFNNRIKVNYDYLEYATLKDKLSFINTVREIGVVTVGLIGNILDIDVPTAAKDRLLISQNYMQSLESQKETPKTELKEDPTDEELTD